MFGASVGTIEHRPWPVPATPWVMAQSWRDLLFAHWPIAPDAMRALLPSSLDLDTFEGNAWLGVVPFGMRGVRPRWVPPVPWLSNFLELNVRTYVRVRDRGQVKAGVYFFSLDAANSLAVMIARRTFRLPYYHAAMTLRAEGEWRDYTSHRIHRAAPGADFVGRYRPLGPVYRAQPGTLDHWLTERYSLYTVDRRGQAFIGEIHHAPWPLQPAEATFEVNSMAGASAFRLPDGEPLLHFARRLDVVVWPLRPIQ